MMRLTLLLLMLLLFLPPSLAGAQPDSSASTRRWALVVGANRGGPKGDLRWAVDDARAFRDLLITSGDVRPEDATLIADPSASELRRALDEARAKLASAPPQRAEFVLYYSGHADARGLLLGPDRLGYDELRRAVDSMPSALELVVIDACEAGAIARPKGGAPVAPLPLAGFEPAEGSVYLTASASTELAQESDHIRSSFFTHFLLTGMRGAADASRDGRVTLNEAYRFAFDETLRKTATSQLGPQHPTYDMALAGSGELVLTRPASSNSRLILGADLEGRLYIWDERGRLAAEFYKAGGTRALLSLEPGRYEVYRRRGEKVDRAELSIAASEKSTLGAPDFRPAPEAASRARARGALEPAPPSQEARILRDIVGEEGARIRRERLIVGGILLGSSVLSIAGGAYAVSIADDPDNTPEERESLEGLGGLYILFGSSFALSSLFTLWPDAREDRAKALLTSDGDVEQRAWDFLVDSANKERRGRLYAGYSSAAITAAVLGLFTYGAIEEDDLGFFAFGSLIALIPAGMSAAAFLIQSPAEEALERAKNQLSAADETGSVEWHPPSLQLHPSGGASVGIGFSW